jgi:inner membrane protein
MRRLEHAIIGAGCAAAVAHVAGLEPGWSMLVGVVGASIPDIDLKWSDRWNRPRPGSPCKLLDHRGPTHSLSLAVMVGLAVGFGVAPWLGLMLTVGWLSHLAADAGSFLGVPFFWPIYSRRLRLLPRALRVRSGTTIIELPVALATLFAGLYVAGLR